MRRLFPKSLGGQFAALLVAGLLSAQVASLLILSGERSRAVDTAIRGGAVERVAALIEVMDDAPPDTRARLADVLSTRSTSIAIEERSLLPEDRMTGTAADFAELLEQQLGPEPGGRPPRVWIPEEPSAWERGKRMAVAVSYPLRDGSWFNLSFSFRKHSGGRSWPWLVSLAASAAATLAVAALAVRRITRPMRALAAAAERMGRGEPVRIPAPKSPSEIRTTVEAFNAMQERLSRFVRDRTRMVAAISHDLRTPITSLRLRAEFIEDEDLKRDVVRTLDEMQAMTDATLAFARGEESGEETRSVDLAALIDGVVDDLVVLGNDVTYTGPERLAWRCRPVSLKRAIGNLVGNAVRYAGSARIGLSQAGGEVVITVEDEGPGIPEGRLDDVFEPFVRLETSRSRETGGAGLGLSIARSIVRAHGGELTLANRRGGGLIATMTLP